MAYTTNVTASPQYVQDINSDLTVQYTSTDYITHYLGVFTPEGYLVGDVATNTAQTRSLFTHAVTQGGCDVSILTPGKYTIRQFDANIAIYDCSVPELHTFRELYPSEPEVYVVLETSQPIETGLNLILLAIIIAGFGMLMKKVLNK